MRSQSDRNLRMKQASQSKFRVEKLEGEWAIIRELDGHPVIWCNSPQQARAMKKVIERDYARDGEHEAGDHLENGIRTPEAA